MPNPPDDDPIIIGRRAPGGLQEGLSCAEITTIINSVPNNTANAALLAKLSAVKTDAGC